MNATTEFCDQGGAGMEDRSDMAPDGLLGGDAREGGSDARVSA